MQLLCIYHPPRPRSRLEAAGAAGKDEVLENELKARLKHTQDGQEKNMKIDHFCRFEDDVGVKIAVDSIAGLGKVYDDKYTQVFIEVRPW